jgi:hypothetical protein
MEMTRWISLLREAFDPIGQEILTVLPRLAGALALALFGWLAAYLLQQATVRIMTALNRTMSRRAGMADDLDGAVEHSAPAIIGRIVFWTVLVFVFAAATELIGLPVMSSLLSGVAHYLPNVIAAVLIGFAGVLAGKAVRTALTRAAQSAGVAQGGVLARAAQAIIVSIAVLVGIDQIGIDIRFLMILIALVVGLLLGGIALAFALGATTLASNIIASHDLARSYRTGQTVRIGDVTGRILELTSTAVLIDTTDGRLRLPAKLFSEQASLLITDRG